MKIIFAQGNPGSDYNNTRHNVGFAVLDKLVLKLESKWETKSKFNSLIAEVKIADKKVLLVKPNTFYNDAGTSARKLVDFYKFDSVEDLLVIHDDLALPFGTLRVRKQGSDAGNNGIKSINSHIGENYTRIRIGISNDIHKKIEDTDFVLGKFTAAESEKLEKTIIPQTIDLINNFCNENLQATSHKNLE